MFVVIVFLYASDMFIYLLHEFAHNKLILIAFISDVNRAEKEAHT